MNINRRAVLYTAFLFLILFGAYFRYAGIAKQLSYWNDESHAAIYARGLAQEGSAVNPYGKSTGLYQSAFYAVTALSFKLFGVNELAGRLPSVVAGSFLIILIFIVTKKMVDERVAFLAAFLTTFSQMQLAWSTQLRPYIWMELITVTVVYWCYRSIQNKKSFIDNYLLGTLPLTLAAFLFHTTGLMNIVIIGIAVVIKAVTQKRYRYILLTIPIALLFIALLYLMYHTIFSLLFRFEYDPLHYRIFFTQNYKWLLAGSGLGTILVWRKNKTLSIFLTISVVAIFTMAIFKIQTRYVRYSLTAFPLLYILFSTGVIYLVDIVANITNNRLYKYSIGVVIVAAALALPLKKHKLLLMPEYYYTINADMRENPIVDYKTAFDKIRTITATHQDVIVMDSWNDRVPWYMPDQKFVYINREKKATDDPVYGEQMIGTIPQLEEIKKNHNVGVILVENWESQMPPEIQDYVRKTFKHEFDVNNLPYNEEDKWSISIYSWGL